MTEVLFPIKTYEVGLMAASPDGEGFEAKFENFSVKQLPDMRRLQWLETHAE